MLRWMIAGTHVLLREKRGQMLHLLLFPAVGLVVGLVMCSIPALAVRAIDLHDCGCTPGFEDGIGLQKVLGPLKTHTGVGFLSGNCLQSVQHRTKPAVHHKKLPKSVILHLHLRFVPSASTHT